MKIPASNLPPFAALENAESDAWAEILRNVVPAFRDRFGLQLAHVAGAFTVLAPKGEDIASLNRVWLPGVAATVTSQALEEIIAHARALGRSRFVAHCPTWAASPEFMTKHGFRQRPSMTKLARRASMNVPESPIRIEEVGRADAELFGQLAAHGNASVADTHGLLLQPWMSDAFNSTVGSPGWKHYFAFFGDTPVATAGLRMHRGFAWNCLASTLSEFRGRGVQLALLNRRIHDAAEAGCEWIVAEAFADSSSLRNQQRAGFEIAYERPNYLADLTS